MNADKMYLYRMHISAASDINDWMAVGNLDLYEPQSRFIQGVQSSI